MRCAWVLMFLAEMLWAAPKKKPCSPILLKKFADLHGQENPNSAADENVKAALKEQVDRDRAWLIRNLGEQGYAFLKARIKEFEEAVGQNFNDNSTETLTVKIALEKGPIITVTRKHVMFPFKSPLSGDTDEFKYSIHSEGAVFGMTLNGRQQLRDFQSGFYGIKESAALPNVSDFGERVRPGALIDTFLTSAEKKHFWSDFAENNPDAGP